MGITIVQKSDLSRPKDNPKIAIVLAGGAVTGGAYKVGGLHALDGCLENRKVTDFDTFVGLSAGSIIASLLANGIQPSRDVGQHRGRIRSTGLDQASSISTTPTWKSLSKVPFTSYGIF